MQGRYKRFIGVIQAGIDLILLNFSFLAAYAVKMPVVSLQHVPTHYYNLLLIINLTWLVISQFVKLYDVPRFALIESAMSRSVKAVVIHAAIIIAFIFSIKGYYYSRELILNGYLVYTFLLFITKLVFLYLLKEYRKSGYNFKKVIIIGEGTIGNQLYNYFNSDLSAGYKILGFFHNNPEQCIPQRMVTGSLNDVEQFIATNPIDEIYCALSLSNPHHIRKVRSLADNSMIRFRMVPDFRGFLNKKVKMDFYYDTPVLTFRPEPLESSFNSLVKRSFDIVFSLFVIISLLPVFPFIVLAIKMSSPGPIFFKQCRSGRNNEIFQCYKFRSMALNAKSDKIQASKDDPRITKVGKFLRKTNIDELPQFINVLLGQMSVVGPRPHMLSHTEEYSKIIKRFMVRQFVKPGITGWAQVNGFRGPLDKRMMLKRVSFDVWYIENWSLMLDIKIILRTVGNMVVGEKNAF